MPQFKTIGLIGGMSWVSTTEYYARICTLSTERFGGNETPPILLYSIRLAEFVRNNEAGLHEKNLQTLLSAAVNLQGAGVDAIALTANTPHMFADQLEKELNVPLLHIVDPVAEAIQVSGCNEVLLLGTKPTMESDFYRIRLKAKGIEVNIPEKEIREQIHSNILHELTHNKFTIDAKQLYTSAISDAASTGIQGVIMGCTEIPALLHGIELPLPAFDTLELHCQAIFEFACSP